MNEPNDLQISFSHVQLFVDHLQDLSLYQQLQTKLNAFHEHDDDYFIDESGSRSCVGLESKKRLWEQMTGPSRPFVSHGRDIVQQLLAGLGFRITRAGPQRMLVTSCDPKGIQFIVAAPGKESASSSGIFSQGKFIEKVFFFGVEEIVARLIFLRFNRRKV